MKRRTIESVWITTFLIALILSGGVSQGAAQSKGKGQEQKPGTQELVWPLLPDPPRIRWVGQFSSAEEIEQKRKKQSWFERVAGAKQEKEKERRLASPYSIAADSRGRIFVADWLSGGVLVFDQSARKVDVWGPERGLQMRMPLGVTVGEEDRVFVADATLRTVLCLTSDGKLVRQFGADKLERPVGLAVDKVRHRLYVSDTKGNRIAVFNSESFEFIKYIGEKSAAGEPGKFRSPLGIAVDKRGFLYVVDTFNHRVQIFNRQDRFQRAFGTHGNGIGQFARPKGVAVDSDGNIYVTDAEFNNFQIFNQQGQPLLFVGVRGVQPGQFTLVTGIFIDEKDRIYTTEPQFNPRVQIFQYISESQRAGGKEVGPDKK
ncbi:MAG: hypothetical protein M1453_08225 [Acidobacteria bacterium]|nr:hypothetical protein [Acidobacteriota bacterium]MCL5287963.1 hypothetical protein [Acidobacteriota bacterium]